jgi:hypothetical protein
MNATDLAPVPTTKAAPSKVRTLLFWLLSFLAIPIAGYLGTFVVGRVDNLVSALLGGAVVGVLVSTAQAFASRKRLRKVSWIITSTIGTSIGVAVGTLAINYRTTLMDLIVGGLITGVIVGIAQAIALPAGTLARALWIPITAALWALAWAVTTLAGIKVELQFIVFGATGAFVYTVLAGLALMVLLRAVASKPTATAELISR